MPDEPHSNEPLPVAEPESDVGMTEPDPPTPAKPTVGPGPGHDGEEAAAYRENDA